VPVQWSYSLAGISHEFVSWWRIPPQGTYPAELREVGVREDVACSIRFSPFKQPYSYGKE